MFRSPAAKTSWAVVVLFFVPQALYTLPFVEGAAVRQQCNSKDSTSTFCTTADYTTMGSYELIETVPHDPLSFTQGLELYNSTHMYESAGLYKQSRLRLVEISTGKVVKETKLEDRYFAEGLTRCRHASKDSPETREERLILLTWQEQTAFVVDPESLEIRSSFVYTTTNNEGWGVACDETSEKLFVSDGTASLHIWNATTMKKISEVQVSVQFTPEQRPQRLKFINELEMDSCGFVLANVWYQDVLAQIQPDTGVVRKVYDLSTLRPRISRGPSEDCLNGIARVSDDVYWVTGKMWPFMYKVRLLEERLKTES